MKSLRCRDAGFDCDFEVQSETVDEILQRAAEHVASVHNLEVKTELTEQVRGLIQDEE